MAPDSNIKDESEQLKATIMQKLKAERDIEVQVRQLEKQVRELRRKSKRLVLKSEKEEPALAAAITEFAKQDCRKLCDKMYKVFPREIRDMVYGHINHKRTIFLAHEVYEGWVRKDCTTYLESKSEYHLRTGSEQPVEDHIWRKEYMGEGIMRELAEHYFQSVCFHFGEGWDFIQKFRVTDQWDLGWVPGEFVTNVDIVLDCSAHVYKTWPVPRDDPWGGGTIWVAVPGSRLEPAKSKSTKSELLVGLEYLFGFRRGTKVTLHLRTSHSDLEPAPSPEGRFGAMAPIIFSTLRRLFDTGIFVNLVCSRNCEHHPTLAIAMTAEHHDLDIFQKDFKGLTNTYHKQVEEANENLEERWRLEEAISQAEEEEDTESEDGGFYNGFLIGADDSE